MASSEVGQATIKLTFDTKSLSKSQSEVEAKMSAGGSESGSKWANAWSVAAGNLIAKGIEKVTASIANNIDNAVKRVDTLNNFPKVMQNMGISAEASAKVINDLSDKLTGLPTTLDAATLAVQRLTSKNGDVAKSEKIFLAVNNAILAGGASAEIQSSALEQLSQAYAKGKPDMMEWRTLQQAMPAQLKQVSKAMLGNADALDKYIKKARQYAEDNPMRQTAKELLEQFDAVKKGSGDMTTALGTALRTGIISMDEFTDTLIKMDTEGIDGFASLSKQAKDATGGIATSMTNLNTAISRAIANVFQSIGPERISGAIKELTKFINSLGKSIAGVVSFLVDNSKTIMGVLAGVGTALATAFAIDKIKSFATAIKGLKNALSGPGGLISLAVELVAGLVSFVAVSDDVDSRMSETAKHIQTLGDAITENKRSWEELMDAQKKQLSEGMSEINYYQSLADELDKIVDENGKVKQGYEERAGFITSKLKDALGVEIEYSNGVVKGYQAIRESINQVIAQKKAKIILDSQEAGYTEAVKKQTEALQQMGEANSQMSKKHAEWMMLEQQLAANRANMSQAAIDAVNSQIFTLKNEEQQYSDTLRAQQDQYGQYAFQIGVYEENMTKFHQGKYDEMNTATWDYISKYKDANTAEKEMLEDQITATRGALNQLKELYEQTGNETYKSQYDAQQKKYDNLVQSHKRYETETKKSLGDVQNEWSKTMNDIVKEADRKNEMNKAGQNIVGGLIAGINQFAGGAIGAITNIGSVAISAFKGLFGIHSPSRLMAQFGRYIDEGLAIGISSSAAVPVRAAGTMSEEVASAITGTPTASISIPSITDRSSTIDSLIAGTASSGTSVATSGARIVINNQINNDLDARNISQVVEQAMRRAAI